ncbi:hypothetical protein [Ferruginibacter sp.]
MKLIGTAFLISFFLVCKGQTETNEIKKLVDSAISLKIEHIIKFATTPELKKRFLSDIYLIDEKDLPYLYSGTRYNVEFVFRNFKSRKNRNEVKKKITAWKIFTSLEANQFKVSIALLIIYYKKRAFWYLRDQVTEFAFEYNCERKKWEKIEAKSSRAK